MRFELQSVLESLRNMQPTELPELLGELEILRATALLRLSAPVPTTEGHDELIAIEPAAKRLGCGVNYLYRHAKRFPFTRRHGRKLVFSSLGIDAYIRSKASK